MAQTNVQAFSGDVEISSNLAVSGNLNATGSLAQGGQKIYPERRWEVDLSSGTSTSNFYPLYLETEAYDANIGPFMFPVSFRVVGDSLSGADSFNEETLVGYARGGGASDHVGMCKVHSRRYDAGEFRCLGIWEGTSNAIGIVIYLRGGYRYSLITDATDVVVNKSSYSKDNSTWAVKNASKTDVVGTSVGIGELQDVSAFVQVGEVSSFTGSLILPESSARLGIGTANPDAKLDVHVGTVAYQGIQVSTTNNGFAKLIGNANDNSHNPIVRAGDLGIVFSPDSNAASAVANKGFYIAPWANTVSGLRINDDGNVGIGMASPGATLHVNGIIKQTGASWSLTNADTARGSGLDSPSYAYFNVAMATTTNVTHTSEAQGSPSVNTRTRITTTTAGKYAVGFNGFKDVGYSNSTLQISLHKNGSSTRARAYTQLDGNDTFYQTAGGHYSIIDMAANDFLEVYIADGQYHTNDSLYFSGHLIA